MPDPTSLSSALSRTLQPPSIKAVVAALVLLSATVGAVAAVAVSPDSPLLLIVGPVSLAAFHLSFALSSLFVAARITRWIGCRRALLIASVPLVLYNMVTTIAMNHGGGHRLRQSVLTDQLGESYIDLAFRVAHGADPTAKLYLNEFATEYDIGKHRVLLALLRRLIERGVPIHGVGFEAHLALNQPQKLQRRMQEIADLGLEVAITELDVRMRLAIEGSATDGQLRQQAEYYAARVVDCLNVDACVGVSTWDVYDGGDWVPLQFGIPGFGQSDIFDKDYRPKPAFDEILNALHARRANGTANTTTTNLHAAIRAAGKEYFGSILDTNTIDNPMVTSILRSQYGAISPEYSMKWLQTEPTRGNFDFAASDRIVGFASSNNMLIRGHNLVWGNPKYLPAFVKAVNNDTDLIDAIQNHVRTVVARYNGRMRAWDVVNEPIDDGDPIFQLGLLVPFALLAGVGASVLWSSNAAVLFVGDEGDGGLRTGTFFGVVGFAGVGFGAIIAEAMSEMDPLVACAVLTGVSAMGSLLLIVVFLSPVATPVLDDAKSNVTTTLKLFTHLRMNLLVPLIIANAISQDVFNNWLSVLLDRTHGSNTQLVLVLVVFLSVIVSGAMGRLTDLHQRFISLQTLTAATAIANVVIIIVCALTRPETSLPLLVCIVTVLAFTNASMITLSYRLMAVNFAPGTEHSWAVLAAGLWAVRAAVTLVDLVVAHLVLFDSPGPPLMIVWAPLMSVMSALAVVGVVVVRRLRVDGIGEQPTLVYPDH